MHRITLWISTAVSALALVACFVGYVNDTTKNPAVPTDDNPTTSQGTENK